jgi:hypothetical protein
MSVSLILDQILGWHNRRVIFPDGQQSYSYRDTGTSEIQLSGGKHCHHSNMVVIYRYSAKFSLGHGLILWSFRYVRSDWFL